MSLHRPLRSWVKALSSSASENGAIVSLAFAAVGNAAAIYCRWSAFVEFLVEVGEDVGNGLAVSCGGTSGCSHGWYQRLSVKPLDVGDVA